MDSPRAAARAAGALDPPLNPISVPLACVRSVNTLPWASNGVDIIGHFSFLISKSLKLSQLFQLSAASKPLKCVERNTGCYSSFLIFMSIHPISHWLNFGFCCKIWVICQMNLYKNMSPFCELSVQANINHKLKLATNFRVLSKHCSTFC